MPAPHAPPATAAHALDWAVARPHPAIASATRPLAGPAARRRSRRGSARA